MQRVVHWRTKLQVHPLRRKAAPRKRRTAYTLVEMIVVIAIIFVLVALATAGILAGMRSAKVTACASNLRSIYQALRLYDADFGGDPPFTTHMMLPGKDYTKQLIAAVAPYGANSGLWKCPLDIKFGTDVMGYAASHQYTSYSHTGEILGYLAVRRDGTIIFDLASVPDAASFTYFWDILHVDLDEFNNQIYSASHGKTHNRLFGDGHTKHANAR